MEYVFLRALDETIFVSDIPRSRHFNDLRRKGAKLLLVKNTFIQ